jgi:AraC-like DNA-binding protein
MQIEAAKKVDKPHEASFDPGDDGGQAIALRSELARKIVAHIQVEGDQVTSIPGLILFRRTALTSCYSATYEPSIIVYAQGQKHVNIGGAMYVCDESTVQLTSVDMPVISQVTQASEAKPILALILKLDMASVREILSQEEFLSSDVCAGTRGMATAKSTPELLGSCIRLLDLLDTPRDIPFLAGLMQREIVYRLLRSSLGKHLRAIATLGEQSNRTAKAVVWLKENFSKPLRVEDLAAVAKMSVSTFHQHFRTLTQMSPMQYQKRMRLHMARVRMLTEGLDAASAAFEVGYESPTQFNREYRRLFGLPTMRDIKARQLVEVEQNRN